MPESLPPPRLRSPNRTAVLDATPIDGRLDSDHQARVVWDFCRGLDLSPLIAPIRSRQGHPNRAALDPRLAIALWLYVTLEGVGSARQLATLCTEHNAFRWRCGGVTVNHHTLADFRVGPLDGLDGLLTHSVAVLREQGLVDLNRVAQDGTRVRASAGAASFRRKPTREECLLEAEDPVTRLEEEMDDDLSASSRRHAAVRERAARERGERVRQALDRLPELEARKKPGERARARCSTTDAQATVMKMADGGFRPAYDVPFAADTASQGRSRSAVGTVGIRRSTWRTAGSPGTRTWRRRPGARDGICAGARAEGRRPGPAPAVAGGRSGDRGVAGADGQADARAIYKDRAATVECVNAQSRNRGLVRLLVRGVEKVKAVAVWFAVAHNVACGARLRATRLAMAV